MKKMIINNSSALSDIETLEYVSNVVKMGRISFNNRGYCYVTTFRDGVIVMADLTKNGTDIFRVSVDPERRVMVFREKEISGGGCFPLVGED